MTQAGWEEEPPLNQPVCSPSTGQVNENARQDLKDGLLLYNTENNVGLKNAWNIIQAEVRGRAALLTTHGRGRAGGLHPGHYQVTRLDFNQEQPGWTPHRGL